MTQKKIWALVAAFVTAMALTALPASAMDGFITDKPAYVTLTVPGRVTPIVSVGEVVDGVMFEGIPDGLGAVRGDLPGTIDVYVSHEQSTVPFRDERDFQDGSVTKWTIDIRTRHVLSAEVAISSDNGFLRFCSASTAGAAMGFSDPVYFANEESNDVVPVPEGAPYGPDRAFAPANERQAGYAVALNTATGEFMTVASMGRLNHENTIGLPGYDQIALLTTDDTFSGPSAQLYLHLSDNEDKFWADKGTLWAFRVTATDDGPVDPSDPFNDANDYLDIQPGDNWAGEFIRVPRAIALGLTRDAPQDALEDWSNDNNVFQFIRLEDAAVDKNDDRVVYIADTGRSRVIPDPETGRLVRGPSGTDGFADNGRVFKMEFHDTDPKVVTGFSVVADGDTDPENPYFVPFRAPDNLDTSTNSLMVQEDADDAKIWRHAFNDGSWSVVATVNDVGGESSGILDASPWFGPGAWLLTVQAHDFPFVDEEMDGDVLVKREDGQLLLIRIRGT